MMAHVGMLLAALITHLLCLPLTEQTHKIWLTSVLNSQETLLQNVNIVQQNEGALLQHLNSVLNT